jgi:hypothetical protein
MRIVFTCVAVVSHLFPLVPVARALAAIGHDVTFATNAELAPAVRQAGFRHAPAGLAFSSPEVTALRARASELYGKRLNAYSWGSGFAGILARRMAADLLDLPEVRRADLLVRDLTELGGCVAAERLGLPHAAISILSAGMTPGARDWIAEPLDALRASHGLPPDPGVVMPFRYLTIHQAPRRFLVDAPLPTDRLIRPEPFDRADGDSLPAWVEALPARPTVYATLGTVFNRRPEILGAIVDGLRDEPVNLIVTVGRDQDPDQFGPQPPHIRIERYIPQSLLLPRCDLVVTHGGSGTVMAALANGLPLVVVPLGADQPENAARCEALGVGRTVDAQDLTPASVRAAVRTVLGDTAYRRNAEQLHDEVRALPGPEHAVTLLGELVRAVRPKASDVAPRPAGAPELRPVAAR